MEHNLLSLSTLDPISPTHSGMVEMGSNVLRDKRLCSIGSKLVQTPVSRKTNAQVVNNQYFKLAQKSSV